MFSANRFVAAFLFAAGLASAQKNTFQTAPASGDFLYSNAGLFVQWQLQDGVSPDSQNGAPDLVSVYLGYKAGDVPKVLFPALNGPTSNVPSAGGKYLWQPMDFSKFINGPAPTRDANTQWFIQIADQATGYKSNGQLFHIVEAAAGNTTAPAAPAPPASSAPAASGATGTVAPTSAPASSPTSAVSAAPTSVTSATAVTSAPASSAPAAAPVVTSSASPVTSSSNTRGTPASSQSSQAADSSASSMAAVGLLSGALVAVAAVRNL